MFNFSFIKTKKYKLKGNTGISLIELLMVIAIVTLISSTTLFNHSRFNSSVTLENLAYEIALTIRQAQFFGMYVRSVDLGVGEPNFDTGYGVYFDKSDNTSFILFADVDQDNIYDSGGNEKIDKFNMVKGNKIESICVDSGSGCNSVDEVSVAFKRPNPDAIIKTNTSTVCQSGCNSVMINISSPRENVADKIITVGSTGQISISTAP